MKHLRILLLLLAFAVQSKASVTQIVATVYFTNVVRGVTVDGAGSVGMLVYGATDFTIAGNTVRHTLADGIHTTGGSRHADTFWFCPRGH